MKRQAVFFLACIAAPAFANLLQNSDFESESHSTPQAPLNWKLNEPDDHGDIWGSAIRMDWRARSGSHAVALCGTWANTGDNGGLWQEAEVEPERTYRFSAWLWADADWTANVQELKLEFWDVGRSILLGEDKVSVSGLSEKWTEHSVQGKAPAGAFWVRVVVYVSGVGPSGAMQVDDAALELVP